MNYSKFNSTILVLKESHAVMITLYQKVQWCIALMLKTKALSVHPFIQMLILSFEDIKGSELCL